MSTLSVKSRIERLRAWMEKNKIHAFICPTSDPHKSEYLASHWQSRMWLSGFTGSAGTLVVTRNHAGLWTDSRYFLQAEKELNGTGIQLQKLQQQGMPEYLDWIGSELIKGETVAIDSLLWTLQEVKMVDSMCTAHSLHLVLDKDPFDEIWEDRPPRPQDPIFEISSSWSGETRMERIQWLRDTLHQKGADAILLTTLDEIGWLLHLRGRDVECNPVFISYALVMNDKVMLFLDKGKVSTELKDRLALDGVLVVEYSLIEDVLSGMSSEITLWVDPGKTSHRIFEAIGTGKIIQGESPVTLRKAVKTPTEERHIKSVMLKDGVALVRAFRWLESNLERATVTEADLADQIAYYRSQQDDYFGESFPAIVGYGPNGAIVHYRADHGSAAVIKKEGILLVDSGGQYLDGTTDITRTIALGEPTEEQKKHFTLVLKGHIALATAIFPEGTKGIQLDVFARQYLWQEGLNFGHGTGHGVGFFMNVHEPPQGFVSNLSERGITKHVPGMLSSNEPGFYVEGEYGIRIENLVICQSKYQTPYGAFYGFETVTLFPIDQSLIDNSLLTNEEIRWLNDYHAHVYRSLRPALNEEEAEWLAYQCRPIQGQGL